MNKRKVAIFVEGQAEYIFVRDFLYAWYEYDANVLGVDCYEFRANRTNDLPYPIGSHDSENYFQIYNVGNDRSVLSKMQKEAGRLKNAGFQLVVGLCDMFGDEYHKVVKDRSIDENINQRFVNGRRSIIADSPYCNIMRFHFAIMEVEAWFIGMYQFLQKIDSSLTPKLILQKSGYDVTLDPEKTFYHPAKVMDDIYHLVGKKYDKHDDDIYRITSSFLKEDYQNLITSGKCQSFANFAKDILQQ